MHTYNKALWHTNRTEIKLKQLEGVNYCSALFLSSMLQATIVYFKSSQELPIFLSTLAQHHNPEGFGECSYSTDCRTYFFIIKQKNAHIFLFIFILLVFVRFLFANWRCLYIIIYWISCKNKESTIEDARELMPISTYPREPRWVCSLNPPESEKVVAENASKLLKNLRVLR